jgi:hypothetical protein
VSLPDPAEHPLLTIDEARAELRLPLGRSAFYSACSRGEIPGLVKIGRRRLLATAALRSWLGLDPGPSGGGANGQEHNETPATTPGSRNDDHEDLARDLGRQ